MDGLLSPEDMMLGNEDVGGYFMTPAAGLLSAAYDTFQIPARVYQGEYGVPSVDNPAFTQAATDFTIDYGVLPSVGGSLLMPAADDTLMMGMGGGKIRAYHGSPHDFSQFDSQNIGRGEGNQAYGYGLYFTEDEGIAKHYRDATSRGRVYLPFLSDSLPTYTQGDYDNLQKTLYDELSNRADDRQFNFDKSLLNDQSRYRGGDRTGSSAVADYELQSDYYQNQVRHDLSNEVSDIIADALTDYPSISEAKDAIKKKAYEEKDRLLSLGFTPFEAKLAQNKLYAALEAINELGIREAPKGKMYEVGLLGEKENFLDYDLPLKDQPTSVQNSYKQAYWNNFIKGDKDLEALYDAPEKLSFEDMGIFSESRGSQAYNTLAVNVGEEKASQSLKDAGIPAIKYTADGSRHLHPNDPDATKNFVVFDDKMIDILKKYGLLAPVATGAAVGSGILDVDEQGQQVIY